jgi:hypothetical protein
MFSSFFSFLQKEREDYEVVIEGGKFLYRKRGQILDTSLGPRDAKWIFVLSTSKALYVGQVYIFTCLITLVQYKVTISPENVRCSLCNISPLKLKCRRKRARSSILASSPEGLLLLQGDWLLRMEP